MLRLEDLESFQCELEHNHEPCTLLDYMQMNACPLWNLYLNVLKINLQALDSIFKDRNW